MSDEQGGGFLDRWSRRKVQARAGQTPADEAPPSVAAAVAAPVDGSKTLPALADKAPPAIKEEAPVLTLEDAQALTPESDFTPFVQRAVAPEVRNAAFKKLFADPHFNVMDGLDIYIDDYSKPSPLSAADMAKMVSAQFLKLVDDPEDRDKKTLATDPVVAPEATATATATDASAEPPPATEATRAPDAAEPEETHDDHADLQLQPDHAPGPQGPGPGAG